MPDSIETAEFWMQDDTAADDPIRQSIDDMVSGNTARSRALAGDAATANALIENLGDLHHLIEDQAGEELSQIMIDHVENELTKRGFARDVITTVTLPVPEISHPTARLLSGDALENALILNGHGEENAALVAYTSAAVSALSESLQGLPNSDDVIERIRGQSTDGMGDSPKAVTVH